VWGPQDLEHPVETLLADHVTDADKVDVLGRDSDGQITLGDLEDEILTCNALDLAGLDRLDQCSAVVGIDHRFADVKSHIVKAPFRLKDNMARRHPRRRLRRSEAMFGSKSGPLQS
jgi:hypothetical protein